MSTIQITHPHWDFYSQANSSQLQDKFLSIVSANLHELMLFSSLSSLTPFPYGTHFTLNRLLVHIHNLSITLDRNVFVLALLLLRWLQFHFIVVITLKSPKKYNYVQTFIEKKKQTPIAILKQHQFLGFLRVPYLALCYF